VGSYQRVSGRRMTATRSTHLETARHQVQHRSLPDDCDGVAGDLGDHHQTFGLTGEAP
jgi:hypothetical protein